MSPQCTKSIGLTLKIDSGVHFHREIETDATYNGIRATRFHFTIKQAQHEQEHVHTADSPSAKAL